MTADPTNRPRSGFALDVVGIGALNLDYITHVDRNASPDRRPLTTRIAELLDGEAPVPEWGTETAVDEATVFAALEAINTSTLQTSLGGSAYNAVNVLAQLQLGLNLGYVGVAGRVPGPGLSAIDQLRGLGVDHPFVFRDDDHLCGICFSLTEDGDRTLLTHAGANSAMADHLARSFDEVVAYLATARVVHVTSFLDDRTPAALLATLRAVKEASPATLISFDPGHVWCTLPTEEVLGICGLTAYLMLNHREFHELGRRNGGDTDEDIAGHLLQGLANDRSVIVVKRRTGIHVWRSENGKAVEDFHPQIVLADDQIEDATGAGDVFAAGLLAVLTSDRLQVELGSLLGMTLARHKLRYVGSHGHGGLAAVTKDFIRSHDAARRAAALPAGVFIAHGRSPEWLAVKSFVERRFGLPVYSFESDSWGSRPVTEALTDYLQRCSFAICVLTAEDATGDGQLVARQNVIHEIGLFQGHYGFDRVIVLAEDGCESVPLPAEPYTSTFPRHAIDRTFWYLDRALQNQGFSHI
ncbi:MULTISPECIES: PfkB family carbohydrate kinase [unclassified Streptomyces]|uniref:PfkB family carbohydrate kinase n=1 Tax=unclassified Streptomyces TaxID=2593676 RepID=UPI000DC793E2|nr:MULTISPECIES: PfkB family carbohydrate kinase [unclassified Streptomyces]AWZ08177.1 ribokinase [Streptomyces sp. ICC4]AWZ17089.1 ribokinase [Streptomyces sp. ICC1]